MIYNLKQCKSLEWLQGSLVKQPIGGTMLAVVYVCPPQTLAYLLSCFPNCAIVQWADVSGLYGLCVHMAVSGDSNWSSAVHSTQPEGPAPEEEALHLPAARLAGTGRYCQGAQRCGGQISCQGIGIVEIWSNNDNYFHILTNIESTRATNFQLSSA